MSLLEELVAADINLSHFARKLAGHRSKREKQKAKDYKFYGSLAVSDIQSLYDCPAKLISNKKDRKWYAKNLLASKMDEGSEIHRAYQEVANQVPGLKAPDPTNIRPELLEKYKERGELPARLYSKCGKKLISGYIDFVQLYKEMISVVEIKSTFIPEEDFKVRFKEKVLDPNKKHKIQTKTYMYLIRPYWPGLIHTKAELVYICGMMAPGTEGREHSIWVELTDQDILMYDLMFTEIERQLLAPEPLPCGYLFCRDHGAEGKRPKETTDEN